MSWLWISVVWLNIVSAAYVLFRTSRSGVEGRDSTRFLTAGAFAFLLFIVLRDVVNVAWFEDDALITFQYSKNLSNGCGWNFNCGGGDFATSSYLQTLIGTVWFLVAEPARALHIEKLWENVLVIWGSLAFVLGAVRLGASRAGTLFAISLILLSPNSFQYLFSGMENALGFALLSGLLGCYAFGRFKLVGIAVGLLVLVRPEYALAGVSIALIDLGTKDFEETFAAWLKRWAYCASVSAITFLPVFSAVWVLNGRPFADTLEIKRLTASNWGSLYHENLWTLARPLGPALIVVVLGAVGLLLQRSSLLFLPLFSALIGVVYWRLGLPSSPWYYMPFWLGLSSSTLGFPFLYRRLRAAWAPGWTLHSRKWRLALSSGSTLLILLVVVGNPVQISEQNLDFAERVASKRNDINTSTGLYLRAASNPGDRVALPNIGYVGFYSDRFIVDLVGLVTPDASLSKSSSSWRQYEPRFYVDKAHIAERLLELEGYHFRAVIGSLRHKGERFVVLEDSRYGASAATVRLDTTSGSPSSGGWEWTDVTAGELNDENFISDAYVSVSESACQSEPELRVSVPSDTVQLQAAYTNRGGFFVMDTASLVDIGWADSVDLELLCADGTPPDSETIMFFAVSAAR